MSADNGIYVLQTRKAVSCGYIEYEYRIAHTRLLIISITMKRSVPKS